MQKKTEKFAKALVYCIIGGGVILAVLVAVLLGVNMSKEGNPDKIKQGEQGNSAEAFVKQEDGDVDSSLTESVLGNDSSESKENEEEEQMSKEEMEALALKEQKEERKKILMADANVLALGYDYDKAIELVKSYEDYNGDEELESLVTTYEKAKEELVPYGAFESAGEISHVFFHSLIADTKKAFDGDFMSNGYNYWMTTVDEFKEMLTQMYERGYVLVSIHDVAYEKTLEDGTVKMVPGDILLPADKKPFVLSQDDVNFYEYMRKDGFATRIVIDENGYPACEINMDGEIFIDRDYDVVPILEKFIEEHPDFSYRGARGIIGVTGYEGVMGYRTNEKDSQTYEDDLAAAKKVADRLKEIGWEFASHSYGHGHMGKESADYVRNDSEHWDKDVASIIGKTDIYLYPYGEDIMEGVGKYTGAKYEALYNFGFRYYCGVYAYPWLQINQNYVRMTRRNLDGFTMHNHPERLDDLFDVETVYDLARPEFK